MCYQSDHQGVIMRKVGVKEFRDNATKLLASGETMLIERHGHPVGYFIPVKTDKDNDAAKKALQRLEAAVNKLVQKTGTSEKELADLFTLKRD